MNSMLSVVINTKNAASTLKRALTSVRFADEVVVMDMASDDATQTLARAAGARVLTYPDVGYVEPARNAAVAAARAHAASRAEPPPGQPPRPPGRPVTDVITPCQPCGVGVGSELRGAGSRERGHHPVVDHLQLGVHVGHALDLPAHQ